MASTGVAGKVQIAQSVAKTLACPLYQGDSMHESTAKAASVGTSRPSAAAVGAAGDAHGARRIQEESSIHTAGPVPSGPNGARYQRMWLSKMTRTGLLFPEESKAATEGFTGFGGTSSTSTSRRGSASSIGSVASSLGPSSSITSSRHDSMSSSHPAPHVTSTFPPDASASGPNVVFTLSEEERLRRANPALMVLTHPELETWHKLAIRTAVGDYGIGVIFVPLYAEDEDEDEEEDLPILQPLDPRTMTSFPVSFGSIAKKTTGWGNLDEEMKLHISVNADVEGKITEIIDGVRDVMGVNE